MPLAESSMGDCRGEILSVSYYGYMYCGEFSILVFGFIDDWRGADEMNLRMGNAMDAGALLS